MADLNKMMILGNVGRDPEIRYTANGNAKAEFSVAVNRRYQKPTGDYEEETEWFNVVTWGKLAERMSQNTQKGDRVYVEGRIQTRSWETGEQCIRCRGTGQGNNRRCFDCGGTGKERRKVTELIADRVLPQGRRQPAMAGEGGYPARSGASANGGYGGMDADMTDPDDLPFD